MACQIGRFTTAKLFSYMEGRGDHRLVVPMFQRNICWKEGQEDCFIDSLVKGYPVGSMLFHETDMNGGKAYVLIDGLQRCNTIKKYMSKPLPFYFSEGKLPPDLCSKLCSVLALNNAEDQVRKIISSYLLSRNDFSSCDELTASDLLIEELRPEATRSVITETIALVRDFLRMAETQHSFVAGTEIPVIIYSGNESDLAEVFSRINSKGTVLGEYEVYAASWPSEPRCQVKEKAIVENAKAKYRIMRENGFEIYQDGIQDNKLSAFEFLFGLSRYLYEKHGILRSCKPGGAKDGAEILTAGFELAEVCLSSVPALPRLYEHLSGIDINKFAEALSAAVAFTEEALSVVKRFKANSQKGESQKFRDKNQVLAISGRVFRLLYPGGDLSKPAGLSAEEKRKIQSSILENYVYDIIKGYWDNAGKKKRFAHAQDDKYLHPFSWRDWSNTLDTYFEDELVSRKEIDKVPAPSAADCIILNCIYVNSFSARDQLSNICFDIEHLAPRNQMRKKLKACGAKEGLAISSIANLCYLPQEMNRKHISGQGLQRQPCSCRGEVQFHRRSRPFLAGQSVRT